MRAILRLHYLYLPTELMKQSSPPASPPASYRSAVGTPSMSNVPIDVLIRFRRRFLAFIRPRVSDAETAEDILQMAYLRALSAKDGLHDEESAVAWFYRILRNAIIDFYRSRGAESAAHQRWAMEFSEAPTDLDLREMVCRCVEAALDTLTPAYAEIVRAVDLEGAKLAEYAATHGTTPGNAAVRIHRARASLKKQLIRCCGSCALHGCLHCTCRTNAGSDTRS